jgi:LysM repeat protein
MSLRRMLPFIFLNIIVSAAVVLVILWWWDGRKEETLAVAETAAQVLPSTEETLTAQNAPDEIVQATETPLPQSSGPDTHIVAAGETLGQISGRYDISVDEIMAVNGMNNPNFLSVGQELIIPIEGAPETAVDTPPETSDIVAEDVLPTPIPTEPAGEGEAIIEISEVVSAGELSLEAVQIVNNGGREMTLSDWKLADQFGHYYTFGPITLFGDGAGILVHTAQGQNSATDLYWGEEGSRWNSGDMVILYDAAGTVQAEFQVP